MDRMQLLVGLLIAVLCPSFVSAQGDDTNMRFVTSDGVTLRGQFFGGNKNSDCVLLLHDLGELRHDRQWRTFAKVLHKQGFAVLRFHFRGHGQSTDVDPDIFWSPQYPANRRWVRTVNQDAIDFQNMDSSYHAYLINDIAAAKAYLDRKNDAGECNSSNLILICCGRSGALGAAWIHAEMHRYRQLPSAFVGAPPQLANSPEGTNVLCALFINLSPHIGKRRLALASALQGASRGSKIPLVFFHGSEDNAARRVAKETEKSINPGRRLPLTGISEVPNANGVEVEKRLAGDDALHKELVKYLKQVQQDRGKEWQEHEWREAVYYWRNPYVPASLIPFNQAGDNLPPFVSYELFLPTR